MKNLTVIFISVFVWAMAICANVAFAEVHCYYPPDYDYTITPEPYWQAAGSIVIESGYNNCRIYRMYLYADRGYTFSICDADGVGGSCSTLGYFTMYDSDGNFAWGQYAGINCPSKASTIGTPDENWSPSADGYCYLKIYGTPIMGLACNLAFKSEALPDPDPADIRVEPNMLYFHCTDAADQMSQTSRADINEQAINSNN